MLYIPNDEMFPNKFVEVALPTKGQIFDRTGKRAVTPNGSFSADDPVRFRTCPTASAQSFLDAAEAYEASTKEDNASKKEEKK